MVTALQPHHGEVGRAAPAPRSASATAGRRPCPASDLKTSSGWVTRSRCCRTSAHSLVTDYAACSGATVVGGLHDVGQRDVAADPGQGGPDVSEPGKQQPVPRIRGADRRIDQGESGDRVPVLLGEPEGQPAAHGQTAATNTRSHSARRSANARSTQAYQSSHRVWFSSCHVVPCPGSRGSDDPEAVRLQVLGPWPHRLRRPGEAVTEQHPVRPRPAVVGLGVRHDGRGRRGRRRGRPVDGGPTGTPRRSPAHASG